MTLWRRIDPMVRLIGVAIVLATLLPVRGSARDVAQFISNAAVFLLFLLYGLRLSRAEVRAGLSNHRLLVPLVLWVFGVMALGGWLVWQGEGRVINPLLALGFLYMGTLPSTVQSATAYSSLAGGNVASSVVAAALLNIMGVFISAPLFSALAGSHVTPFHAAALVKVCVMLLAPFIAGQMLQHWARDWMLAHRQLVSTMDRSSIGIAVYVAFSGAVVEGIWHRVTLPEWGWLLAGVGAILMLGYGGAWMLGGLLRLPRDDRISLLFAGAHKSIAMGAPLATVLFAPTAAGIVLLPLLVYHLCQMVIAAPIAEWLRRSFPPEPLRAHPAAAGGSTTQAPPRSAPPR